MKPWDVMLEKSSMKLGHSEVFRLRRLSSVKSRLRLAWRLVDSGRESRETRDLPLLLKREH